MAVRPIPEGFHTVTPYLTLDDAAGLIHFLKRAFDAVEDLCTRGPDGAVMHAQMKVGDSMVMIGQAAGPWPSMPCALYLYVPDTDAVYKRALEAGATSLMEPANQFYGDRNAGVKDPFGNVWWIGTHVEDVSPEEIQRRMASMGKG